MVLKIRELKFEANTSAQSLGNPGLGMWRVAGVLWELLDSGGKCLGDPDPYCTLR